MSRNPLNWIITYYCYWQLVISLLHIDIDTMPFHSYILILTLFYSFILILTKCYFIITYWYWQCVISFLHIDIDNVLFHYYILILTTCYFIITNWYWYWKLVISFLYRSIDIDTMLFHSYILILTNNVYSFILHTVSRTPRNWILSYYCYWQLAILFLHINTQTYGCLTF